MWLGFGNEQMETRLLFIKELARHGYKCQLTTADGDAIELERLNTACEGIKTKISLVENGIK